MLDKLGKSISLLATVWGFWNIGKMVNPLDYTIEQQLIYVSIAVIFSLIWTFYLMGSFEKSLNRGALLRYGLVPALSWVLNAPMVKDMYITVAIDREYPIVKEKFLKEIEPINAKIEKYESLLDKEKEKSMLSLEEQKEKLEAFKSSHASYVSRLESKYITMREEYKKMNWEQKKNSQYKADFEECESKGYSVPSNANAPKAIAECRYQLELASFTATSSSMVKEYQSTINQLKKQKEQLKEDVLDIESKSFLKEWHFYLIMFLFGYFIEIKLANATFWVNWENARGTKKSIKFTSVGDSVLEFASQGEIDNFKATLFAVIRTSYIEHLKLDDMSLNIVQRNMLHVNPYTKKPYSAKRWQKKIRDYLKNKGFERNKNNQEWVLNVINSTTEHNIAR